jgi:hypothetical protein
MKIKLLLLPVLFFTINSIAQDLNYKWSVEANYSILQNGELIRDANGIFDLGIKYRLIDLDFAKLGIGINGGYFGDKFVFEKEVKVSRTFIQPRFFSEFNIPSLEKIHPMIGLGFSYVSTRYSGDYLGSDAAILDYNSQGFNANFGLLYDVSDKVYLQAQYDLIAKNKRLNTFRLGFGFRF